MNRKFFASLFLFLVALTGAFSPVLSLVSPQLEPKIAYAETTTASTTQTTSKSVEEITCGANVLCAIITGYAGFIQFLPHLLAQVSGMLLDYVVWKNLESSTWTSQDTVDSFVVKGWKMVRDFSNLLFIFALFVVGFSLILNGAGSEGRPLFGLEPKRTIARVILMALLINFSFFMCRFIIDVTNLAANVFYNAVTKVETGQTSNQSNYATDKSKIDMGSSDEFYKQFGEIRSISLGILSAINPQQLISKQTDLAGTKNSVTILGAEVASWYEYDWGVYILILFVSSIVGIFNFFLIYLFISSSIFLFARIFGLYFLIILSPIAFVSTTIPALQNKEYFGFDDWFKQLTGLAFSMPIYMFFIYLALFFMKIGEVKTGTGYVTIAVIILVKLVSAGFVLIMGKKVAKDLSGKIGAMASGAVNGVITGTAMIAGAAMTGGASAALRMGGSLARNAAVNTASRVGEVTVGKDNVEAIRQRFSSGNFKSFNRLNNFNPMRGMSDQTTMGGRFQQLGKNFGASLGEAARMSGSQLPDQLGAAYRTGKLTPRAESIARAREEREKKVKALNEEIDRLRQQMRNPNLTDAERKALNQQIKGKQGEIWNLNNPAQAAQTQQNQQGQTGQQNTGTQANQTQQNTQQNSGAQGGTPGTNTATPTANTTGGGAQGAGGGTGAPAANRSVDASLVNGDANKSPLTPEQTKQIATEIENEMRALEKEMNDPATRLNKNRMEELEAKYNGLDSERKGLGQGTVLPARLKSFAGQPVGQLAPKKTFGQGRTDGSLTTDLNLTQQDRVLRKAIEKQERMATKATAQAKGSSKAQSLLSGIATGTVAVVAPTNEQTVGDMDQSGLIETPDTIDFGGIQIPEPESGGGGIRETISNIEVPLGNITPLANMVGLGDKTISVGAAVDAASKLDNPATKYIPEVGPELAAVGKVAGAVKSVGITQQAKPGLVDRFGNPLTSGNTNTNTGSNNIKAA